MSDGKAPLPPIKPSGIYTREEMQSLIREMWQVMPSQDGACADPNRWQECLDRLRTVVIK